MDELAFLTLMPLINHRIPHLPLDFYECRFQLKIEGNHTLFSQGANADRSNTVTRAPHGSDGPPEKKTNINRVKTHTIDKWAPRAAHRTKGKVGGPTRWPADHPGRPTSPRAPPPSGSTWLLPVGFLCRLKKECS